MPTMRLLPCLKTDFFQNDLCYNVHTSLCACCSSKLSVLLKATLLCETELIQCVYLPPMTVLEPSTCFEDETFRVLLVSHEPIFIPVMLSFSPKF